MKTPINKELPASRYYVHTSYIPTYYYVYMYLEYWIAKNIFRNDLSRVFMASNDYAFRRRFELTDMSKAYDEIEASSLRFPFANYNILNQGWTANDRPAANTAAQIYLGIYAGTTKVRAADVSTTIPVLFYFDREDDARLAYDTLFFYTFNKHYFSTEVPFANNTLQIPITLEINNISFNPDFKENDWLKQNRIFIIAADFDIDTYAIFPPAQPDYDDTSATNPYYYDDGTDHYYIVQDVVLNLWKQDTDVEVLTFRGADNFPTEGKTGVYYIDDTCAEDEKGFLENPKSRDIKKVYRWNANLWNSDTESWGRYELLNLEELADINVSSLGVNGELASGTVAVKLLKADSITTTSATILWDYDDDYATEDIHRITVSLNDLKDLIDVDVTEKSCVLTDLQPGSHYTVYVCFYSKDGTVKKLFLDISTLSDQKGADKEKLRKSLIADKNKIK